jgi:hypothetical protein
MVLLEEDDKNKNRKKKSIFFSFGIEESGKLTRMTAAAA